MNVVIANCRSINVISVLLNTLSTAFYIFTDFIFNCRDFIINLNLFSIKLVIIVLTDFGFIILH